MGKTRSGSFCWVTIMTDYVQEIKRALERGERVSSVLEGVGQTLNELSRSENLTSGERKVYRAILKKVNEAFDIAQDADL